jgi:hypothetical protein
MFVRRGMRSRSGSRQRHIVTMIMPETESFCDVLFKGSKVLTDALPDRLERLKTISRLRGVNAHALARAMADRDKHGGCTFFDRECLSYVGAPHLIGFLGRNRAIVEATLTPSSWTRLEPIFAHQPADPIPLMSARLGSEAAPRSCDILRRGKETPQSPAG